MALFKTNLQKCRELMPDLIDSMEEDLQSQDYEKLDFMVIRKDQIYPGHANKGLFQYFFEDYDDLKNKIDRLLTLSFIIKDKNDGFYLFTEKFVKAMKEEK